jgi:hypothetical protein
MGTVCICRLSTWNGKDGQVLCLWNGEDRELGPQKIWNPDSILPGRGNGSVKSQDRFLVKERWAPRSWASGVRRAGVERKGRPARGAVPCGGRGAHALCVVSSALSLSPSPFLVRPPDIDSLAGPTPQRRHRGALAPLDFPERGASGEVA